MIGAATGPWHRKADGRFEAEWTVICARWAQFVERLSGFPGLWDWLLAAGFTAVKMRLSSTGAAMGRAGRSVGMFLARCDRLTGRSRWYAFLRCPSQMRCHRKAALFVLG